MNDLWAKMGYNSLRLSENWTNVSYDWDGDPVQWCGHQHSTAQEAYECLWRPDDPNEVLSITVVSDFDPASLKQCPHLLHPADCERCLAWICQHLQHPWECERCLWLAKGDYVYPRTHEAPGTGEAGQVLAPQEGSQDEPANPDESGSA